MGDQAAPDSQPTVVLHDTGEARFTMGPHYSRNPFNPAHLNRWHSLSREGQGQHMFMLMHSSTLRRPATKMATARPLQMPPIAS